MGKTSKKQKMSLGIRGPNSEVTTKNGQMVKYLVVPLDRKHYVAPGEKLWCACCGDTRDNGDIYQHFGSCLFAQYYVKLQDKFREGFLYLSQRNHENPDTWSQTGAFFMLKPEHTQAMMDKFPRSLLDTQDQNWNVLMPIKLFSQPYGGGATEAVADGYVHDFIIQIARQLRIKHTEMTEAMFVTKFDDKNGNSSKAIKNWDLKHKPTESRVKWSQQEQFIMEEGRREIKKRMKDAGFGGCRGVTEYSCVPREKRPAEPVEDEKYRKKADLWHPENEPYLENTEYIEWRLRPRNYTPEPETTNNVATGRDPPTPTPAAAAAAAPAQNTVSPTGLQGLFRRGYN